MHIKSSLKSAKKRSSTCQLIKRGRRIYVIDKKNRRHNVRQGK